MEQRNTQNGRNRLQQSHDQRQPQGRGTSRSQRRRAAHVQPSSNAGGYIALGYREDTSYVWSPLRHYVQALGPRDLTPATLETLVGGAWALARFPKTNAQGEITGVDWRAVRTAILDDCAQAGVYQPERLRGAGIWREDKDEGSRLVISSKDCRDHTGRGIARVGGHYTYPVDQDIGCPATDTPVSTPTVHELRDMLASWRWARGSDALLLLGWIASAPLCGALEWRPHVWLTGQRGSGKSTLEQIAAALLPAAIMADGDSTEAGIRQHLRTAARPVILDETEAGQRRLDQLIKLLRSASSGSGRGTLRGTADQSGRMFSLRTSILVAGITQPRLRAADASRIVTLELEKLPQGATLPALARDRPRLRRVGRGLVARMVQTWPAADANIEAARSLIAAHGSQRAGDTLGTLMGCAATLIFGRSLREDELREFLADLDLEAHLQAQRQGDESDALAHLLAQRVRVLVEQPGPDAGHSQTPHERSLSEMIQAAAQEPHGRGRRPGPWSRALGRLGLTAQPDNEGRIRITVPTGSPHPEIERLYAGTPWVHGGWLAQLRRIPGAEPCYTRIDGRRSRAVSVPSGLSVPDADDTRVVRERLAAPCDSHGLSVDAVVRDLSDEDIERITSGAMDADAIHAYVAALTEAPRAAKH